MEVDSVERYQQKDKPDEAPSPVRKYPMNENRVEITMWKEKKNTLEAKEEPWKNPRPSNPLEQDQEKKPMDFSLSLFFLWGGGGSISSSLQLISSRPWT